MQVFFLETTQVLLSSRVLFFARARVSWPGVLVAIDQDDANYGSFSPGTPGEQPAGQEVSGTPAQLLSCIELCPIHGQSSVWPPSSIICRLFPLSYGVNLPPPLTHTPPCIPLTPSLPSIPLHHTGPVCSDYSSSNLQLWYEFVARSFSTTIQLREFLKRDHFEHISKG